MKSTNVRDKIKRLREKLKLDEIMIHNYERDRDVENYKERISKQKGIIAEAEKAVAFIRHQRKTALGKIARVKQSKRYTIRQLIKLENFDKIEKMLKLATQIETMSEEMSDGEKHNNTKTR